MLKVGLTGNMGSGKSTVAAVFSCLGIPVYHADATAKRMYQLPGVRDEVVGVAGPGIANEDGTINKALLADRVFADENLLHRLNGIIHPLVREDFRKWAAGFREHPYVIQEAAIIFESGFRKEYDRIIQVSCPQEICIGRILLRDNLTRDQILGRMKHQWDDGQKAALADYIIRNDGSSLVIPQILEIHRQLTLPENSCDE